MSLEDALKENTEAMKALTEALQNGQAATGTTVNNQAKQSGAKSSAGKSTGKASGGKGTTSKASGGKKASTGAQEDNVNTAPPEVPRKDVAAVMLELANNHSRDDAVAILKHFGANALKELKDYQLGKAHEQFKAKLAEHKNAEQASEEEGEGDEDADLTGFDDEDEGGDEAGSDMDDIV